MWYENNTPSKDTSLFTKLASFWDTHIWLDERARNKESFDVARLLVLMIETELIIDSVQLKVNDRMFSIKVVEELRSHHACSEKVMQPDTQEGLGVVFAGDENEVVDRIRDMEIRDRRAWNKSTWERTRQDLRRALTIKNENLELQLQGY
ncbi:hypothetical protein Ancab_026669 [Ancistrocladus abbreviatus]